MSWDISAEVAGILREGNRTENEDEIGAIVRKQNKNVNAVEKHMSSNTMSDMTGVCLFKNVLTINICEG